MPARRSSRETRALVLTCPNCDLEIQARLPALAPELCPRCLAMRGTAVALDETYLPATEESGAVKARA
jgi:hypothetical protein